MTYIQMELIMNPIWKTIYKFVTTLLEFTITNFLYNIFRSKELNIDIC